MKKRRLKKSIIKKLIILLGLILVCFSIYLILPKSIHITKKDNSIAEYKNTNIKELDNKVIEYIKQNKKEGQTIKTNTKEYNKIYFITINISKYNKDTKSGNTSKTYIYNQKKKQFITIENILKDDKSFEKLSLMIRHILKKHCKENKLDLDDKTLKKGIEPKNDNYDNFYLNNKGLTIVFKPYQVAKWSKEELTVSIPWSKTSEILDQNYRKNKPNINRKTRDISKYKNKKVVAFTFDDGPNRETTKILLDNLDKYDAKVTFFVLGSKARNNKNIIKKAYEEGNDIGSHTYSHKELTFLKTKELEKEIDKTNIELLKVIGTEPVYIRPPYGSINDKIKSLSPMHTICWNVDSLDWKTKNRNKIKNKILSNVEDGDIVLLHDIYEESVYGALLAMKELKQKGYSFVTISEMEQIKNVTLNYDKTYYGF